MPCFHFELRGDSASLRASAELPGVDDARIEAARLAGAMIADNPMRFWDSPDWHLDVKNCDGSLLFLIHMSGGVGDAGASPMQFCPAHVLEDLA